jgi:hypothetical protein
MLEDQHALRLRQHRARAALDTSESRPDAEVPVPSMKPLTLRFGIINVFDYVYELRDGSGIGRVHPAVRSTARVFRRRVAAVLS